MTYPPPPFLITMAYMYGSISKEECREMLQLWQEKHSQITKPTEEQMQSEKWEV